ncbi:MAG: PEP-CTERM sorting domain-containing protein [Planctomycetota bacterium]
MFRTHHALAAAAASLFIAGSVSAAVIPVNVNASGRYQSDADATGSVVDYTFGNTLTSAGRVVGGAVPRVGLNGGNNVEFLGIYAYEVTADFAADINSGGTASIQIGAGAAAPNVPASIDLVLLQITAPTTDGVTINDTVIEPAPAGGLISSIVPTSGAQFDLDITAQLTTALGGGTLTVGDYIWVGADTDITGATPPTNIEIGTGIVDLNDDSDLETTLTSTPIPEPTSVSLIAAGLGGLMLRRRK